MSDLRTSYFIDIHRFWVVYFSVQSNLVQKFSVNESHRTASIEANTMSFTVLFKAYLSCDVVSSPESVVRLMSMSDTQFYNLLRQTVGVQSVRSLHNGALFRQGWFYWRRMTFVSLAWMAAQFDCQFRDELGIGLIMVIRIIVSIGVDWSLVAVESPGRGRIAVEKLWITLKHMFIVWELQGICVVSLSVMVWWEQRVFISGRISKVPLPLIAVRIIIWRLLMRLIIVGDLTAFQQWVRTIERSEALLIVIWPVTVGCIYSEWRCSSTVVQTQVLKQRRQQCLLIYVNSDWCVLPLLLYISWIVLIRKMARKSFSSLIITLIITHILIELLIILTLLVVEIIQWRELSHELSITMRVWI